MNVSFCKVFEENDVYLLFDAILFHCNFALSSFSVALRVQRYTLFGVAHYKTPIILCYNMVKICYIVEYE